KGFQQPELKRRKAPRQGWHADERNRPGRRCRPAGTRGFKSMRWHARPPLYLRVGLVSGLISGRTSGLISGLALGAISGRISGLISGRTSGLTSVLISG